MGMNSETGFYRTETADQALSELIREDTAEYGYHHSWRSYGVHVLPGTMFRAQAEKAVHAKLHNLTNDEDAFAAAVYADEDVETRTVTVSGTIDGADWTGGYEKQWVALEALAVAKTRLRAGEVITGVRIADRPVGEKDRWGYERTEPDVTETAKVVVTAPKEATETRYFVTYEHTTTKDLEWSKGHPSQAAARAAITKALNDAKGLRYNAYDVIGITRRVSGAPLVHAERQVTKVAVGLTVTVQKAKPNAKRGGWFVGGWYHA